ncbi:MAG: PilZ domain-containing protein [Desulfobacterales bacterium]
MLRSSLCINRKQQVDDCFNLTQDTEFYTIVLILERRKVKRFRAVDGALVAISPESGRIGQIRNISLSGLAFRYIAADTPEALVQGTVKLQIMFAGEGVWLDGVPAKWVADFDIPRGTSFSGLPLRQTCLQFISLTETQKTHLKEFIRRYTSGNH